MNCRQLTRWAGTHHPEVEVRARALERTAAGLPAVQLLRPQDEGFEEGLPIVIVPPSSTIDGLDEAEEEIRELRRLRARRAEGKT